MAKNTFYSVKQTQREQDPPNFDGVFTERFLLPREVKKMCGIRHFRKTGMGRLRHLRRLRRFSPNADVEGALFRISELKNSRIQTEFKVRYGNRDTDLSMVIV